MCSHFSARATAVLGTSVLVVALVFQAFLSPVVARSTSAAPGVASTQQPQEAGPGTRTPVVLEGELEVLVEDYEDHSVVTHVLRTSNGRVQLRFRGKPPDLMTGARIRVRGDRSLDGALALTSSDVTPLAPGVEALAPGVSPGWVFGAKNVLVIHFKFSTTPGDPYTLDSTTPVNQEVNSFYVENSYGQTSLTFTVTGWHTIAWPSGFGCDFQLWASLADNLATTAGYDLSTYDRRIYAYPYQQQCGFRGVAFMGGPRAWINGTYDRRVVAHELGHTYGLDHSWALICDASGCRGDEYGDLHDTMGAADLGHFNAFQKERIGWLNYDVSPEIQTVSANGQYSLDPMSTPQGSLPKALKILTREGSNDRYIYVEQRVQSGVDSALPPGVVIHTGVPTSTASSRQIDLDRATTADDRILDPGQSITFADASPRVTIETVSSSASGATVSISIEAGCWYGVTPATAPFPGSGGTGAIDITAGPDCAWSASSSVTWLHFTSPTSGTGNGTIQYVVDPNDLRANRSGTVTVGGQTVTINQSQAAAGFISPTNGASVLAPSVTFQWTAVQNPLLDHFELWVGTTAGGNDLANPNRLDTATSYVVSNLPVSRTLYATIRTCWDRQCGVPTLSSITFKTMDRLTGVTLLGSQTPSPVMAGSSAQFGPFAPESVQIAFTGASSNCGVSLSATGLPAGATATFAPAAAFSAAVNDYSLLTVSTTSATPAGSHAFTITAQEAAACGGQTRTASGTLVVTGGAAATALSVTPATGTYGGTTALSATLTSAGTPVSGKTVTFSVNGTAAGSAVTNASGVATVQGASLGALAAGAYPSGAGASFAGDGTHSASNATGSLTVNPRPVSADVTAANKVYDGTTTATLSGCTLTGVVGSDVVSCAGSGSAAFDSAAAGSGKTVTATGLALSGAAAANYVLSPTTATTTATIAARAVTVTAAAKSKQYGDVDPALTYTLTSGGLVIGDSFTGALMRAPGETVGSYAIQQGTLGLSANYALTYVEANLTISARAITVTATAKGKQYGDTDPPLTYDVTGGSLLVGDNFTGALARSVGEAVGTYAILQGTLALNSNYTLTYVGANLTIDSRSVTVTAAANSKQYGDADPVLSYALTSGSLLTGDSFTGGLSRAAGETVGSYAIQQGTLALSTNYAVTYVGANLTIVPRAVTVTADAKTKTYGQADPAFTYQVTSGSLVSGDGVTGALSRVAGELVGTYPIMQGTLALNSNYALTYVGSSLTIASTPVTSVTINADRPAPQVPGTSVTFTAAATGGTEPYQYKFWLYDGATWTIGQNWSTTAAFTWTPATANPNYRVYVFARSAGSTADAAEKMAYLAFPIVSVITGVTLNANLTAPQAPGTSVTFTAVATGGTAPYQYKFWLYDGATWTIGQNWSTTTTFTWTPSTANRNYRVYVFARSAGNTADAAEKTAYVPFPIVSVITAVTLTTNLTAPQAPGTSITFTAAATGGTEPYQYKFWLYDGATWTIGQNWSTTTTFTWTPSTANRNYRVYVFARSAGNTADAAEKTAYVPFPIVSVITAVMLTTNLTAPQAPGTSITFTAAATGGTEPYQYKFWLYDGATWTIGQNWSTTTTFTWTPSTANRNYRVYVFARSAGNTADAAERTAYVPFPIVSVITAVTLTANLTAPQAPGTSVTFTAEATGGTAPYQYKFWLYDGATWTIGQNWSTATTFTWTPATANSNYRVYVFARSAGNSADAAEKMAYVTFPISIP